MDRVVIYPYLYGSQGARNLARALGSLRVREIGRYSPRRGDLLLNWGNPRVPGWWNINARNNVMNAPEAVRQAINKITTLRLLRTANLPVPLFTTNEAEARSFFKGENSRVLCRTTVTAHSGRGIHIAERPDQIRRAALYVKYVPKEREYRIHVMNGQVIDIEQKRRRQGEQQNLQERLIRSHENGWIFARNDIVQPNADVLDASRRAVTTLGLAFGAVDLGWHPRLGVKIYEVNTAPGIEGTTVERYETALRQLLT